MSLPLLTVTGLSKTYPDVSRGSALGAWWRALLGVSAARGREVLTDVHLEVGRGEAVAVLGENGAGKSTLLKLIAGVGIPTRGTCRLEGRVGALLELGAGFQPELTGRENLTNACLLAGLDAATAAASMDGIIEFAGIADSVDQPLKHYSSGMVVRLGFATLTAIQPDLLISDEVLAVGDEAFQKKCIAWLEQFLEQGGSLLLVSHSLYHVQKLCQRAVWLHEGRIRESGPVFEVCQSYLGWHESRLSGSVSGDRIESGARIHSLQARHLVSDHAIEVDFKLTNAPTGARVALELSRTDGSAVGKVVTDGHGPVTIEPFGQHQWLPGRMRVEAWAVDHEGQPLGPRVREVLQIEGKAREFGSVRLPHQWSGCADPAP